MSRLRLATSADAYWTARAQLDRAEWLVGQQRLDEAAQLAVAAAATIEIVGAAPMLARSRALLDAEMVRNSGAGGDYPGGAKNSRAMLSGSLNDKPEP